MMAVWATAYSAAPARTKTTKSPPDNITCPSSLADGQSLRAYPQRQPLQAINAASLALGEWQVGCIAGSPDGAAQLGFAGAADRQVVAEHRDLADHIRD